MRAICKAVTGAAGGVVAVVVEPEHGGRCGAGRPGSRRRHTRCGCRRCHGVHVVGQECRSDGRLSVEVRHSACSQVVSCRSHRHVVMMQTRCRVCGRRRRETRRRRQDPLVLRVAGADTVVATGKPARVAAVVGRDGGNRCSGTAVLLMVVVVNLVAVVMVRRCRSRISKA